MGLKKRSEELRDTLKKGVTPKRGYKSEELKTPQRRENPEGGRSEELLRRLTMTVQHQANHEVL